MKIKTFNFYQIDTRRNLMNETITTILSIIGAAAWIPVIFSPIINHFRRLQVTILDSRILTNAFVVSAGRKEQKNGTILMLALNLYINKVTIFAKNISAIITLKNGTELKSELLDFSTLKSHNDDNTTSSFYPDREVEFNISRTVHENVDNIKYVAFLVENGKFQSSIDDIKTIEIRLKCGKCFSKKSTVKNRDFPRFNSTRLIEKIEVIGEK